jgi:chromate transporter
VGARRRSRRWGRHALTRELTQSWQYAVLAGALGLLLVLRRSVVLALLAAAAIGVLIALAAGTVSP